MGIPESMFQQMSSGVKGEGPFGDTPGTGPWRSMLTEEYAKGIAKSGGVGVSDDVYRTLIMQQAYAQRVRMGMRLHACARNTISAPPLSACGERVGLVPA